MRIIILVLGIATLGLVGWAIAAGDGAAAAAWFVSQPFGVVALADLYLGFLLFGIVVWKLEGSLTTALLWTVPTLLIGNPVPALYLALKLPRIQSLLRAH